MSEGLRVRLSDAGLTVVGEPPAAARVPTSWVQRGTAEGWLAYENPRPVHRYGGPPGQEWQVTHTFIHADAVVLKCADGDLRYRVVHQPDKYADPGDDDTPVTDEVYAAGATRVDWFYDLEREA